MQASLNRRLFLGATGAAAVALAACGSSTGAEGASTSNDPASTQQTPVPHTGTLKTIVVSDLHIGLDDSVSELVKNKGLLKSFLAWVIDQGDVDELVIAGDFLDTWFYPGDFKMPATTDEFYTQIAENNQELIDTFAKVMKAGIRLVYVPGNHDMDLPPATLDAILPGIVQARDARGLGRYRTGARNEVVIEHSHRYEILFAPDPLSNEDQMSYGQPMLPAGYPFARMGVTSLMEGRLYGEPNPNNAVEDIPEPPTSNEAAHMNWTYWKMWKELIETAPVNESLDEPFMSITVNGWSGDYSIRDVLPVAGDDGITAPTLYRHMPERWDEIQRRNYVPAPYSAEYALAHYADQESRIGYSRDQYFDLDSSIDVVVFGHTHVPVYREFTDYERTKYFANSGTWIDNNMDDPDNTATFVVIESTLDGDTVSLLKCLGEDELSKVVPVESPYVQKSE